MVKRPKRPIDRVEDIIWYICLGLALNVAALAMAAKYLGLLRKAL